MDSQKRSGWCLVLVSGVLGVLGVLGLSLIDMVNVLSHADCVCGWLCVNVAVGFLGVILG